MYANKLLQICTSLVKLSVIIAKLFSLLINKYTSILAQKIFKLTPLDFYNIFLV